VKGATKKLKDRYEEDKDRSEDPDEVLGAECTICYEPFGDENQERLSECYHSFCATCVEEYFAAVNQNVDMSDDQIERNMRSCPCCRQPLERQKLFRASAFYKPPKEDEQETGEEGGVSMSSKRKFEVSYEIRSFSGMNN
jgi:hypothetical protein